MLQLSYPSQPVDQVTEAIMNMSKDTSEDKINCVFGALNDENGKLYKFNCVKEAEKIIFSEDLTYAYAPSVGDDTLIILSSQLYFGDSTHYKGVQTVGGTGSLHLAGNFINTTFKNINRTIWVPNPTWENHVNIFEGLGLKVEKYSYLTDSGLFNFDFLWKSICSIPDDNIVLFHGCAHNPTGYDLLPKQWEKVISVCKSKNLYIIVDLAYLGFSSGSIEEDKILLKILNNEHYPSLICTSYSKAFGLYSERVGMLFVSGKNVDETIESHNILRGLIRKSYSSPPTFGSKIITKILSTPSLKEKWNEELKVINQRYISIRKNIRDKLEQKLKLDFSDVTQQRGMFWYANKHLNGEQILYIISQHIHIVKNGRINISSLNDSNIDKFIDVFVEAKQC